MGARRGGGGNRTERFWWDWIAQPPTCSSWASGGSVSSHSWWLSKSRRAAGLQCEKRLWLQGHGPAQPFSLDSTVEALLAQGREVGRIARALFPGGVAVDDRPEQTDEALASTARLVRDPSVPAIFEATFVHEGVLARLDVLVRTSGGRFALCEVKSATQLRDEHLDDVALQLWVARGAGIDVERAEVALLDASYVRGPEGLDPCALFARREVTREARLLAEDVPEQVARLGRVLGLPEPPAIEPSPHCRRPQPCEFYDDCRRGQPQDSIERLPALREATFHELRAAGIARIPDIPDDFPLARAQARARRAHRESGLVVARDLASRLADFGPPSDYLDFEAIAPAVPLFVGSSPYEAIAFQWSLHGVDERGRIEHREFLAEGREDPRCAVAESLVDALGASERPIVVYSSFEARVLDALAAAVPAHASALAALRARLRDLYGVIRHAVYHPRFSGSFSLKQVAPALAPGFGYGGLDEVAHGGDAAHAFARIVRAELDAREEARVRAALLRYCARDTEALVRTHLALLEHLRSVRDRP